MQIDDSPDDVATEYLRAGLGAMTSATVSSNVANQPNWAERPYKGFSSYGPDDVLLFSGRDDDIRRMSTVLTDRNTRIVFLHGVTGCGKSSFLRAGLIPYVEKNTGIEFMRSSSLSPLFIRSTDKPLVELAKRLYEFCMQDCVVVTPDGDSSTINLSQLLEQADLTAFVARLGNDSDALLRLLGEIAKLMPSTLAIVIDQAEEVLTIDRSELGESNRRNFFEFLARLEPQRLDVKLLLAMRSEKFADFHTAVERVNRNFHFRTYALQPLTEAQMVVAIERPTSKIAPPGTCAPYDHYGFSFEGDLARRIVHDVLKGSPPGGAMLVVQLLCDRLYSRAKPPEQKEWAITSEHYASLGGMKMQVLDGIDTELRGMVRAQGKFLVRNIYQEVFTWKKALQILISPQPDGTVVTTLRPKQEIVNALSVGKSKVTVDQALAYLCHDKVRILKREYVVRVGSSETIECYSLTHDAIALALKFWADLRSGQSVFLQRVARVYWWVAIFFAFVSGFVTFVWPKNEFLAGTAVLYATGFALIAVYVQQMESILISESGLKVSRMLMGYHLFKWRIFDQRILGPLTPDLYTQYQRLGGSQRKKSNE